MNFNKLLLVLVLIFSQTIFCASHTSKESSEKLERSKTQIIKYLPSNLIKVFPIEYAIDHEATFKYIKGGGDINLTDEGFGMTLLMAAACTGDITILNLLISMGANLELQDLASRRTALTLAIANGHCDCVKALVDAGANICKKNNTLTVQDPWTREITYVSANAYDKLICKQHAIIRSILEGHNALMSGSLYDIKNYNQYQELANYLFNLMIGNTQNKFYAEIDKLNDQKVIPFPKALLPIIKEYVYVAFCPYQSVKASDRNSRKRKLAEIEVIEEGKS